MSSPELDEVNPSAEIMMDENNNHHDNENIDDNDFNNDDSNGTKNQQENQSKPPPRKRRRLVISCTECHRRKQKVRSLTRQPLFSTIQFIIPITLRSYNKPVYDG